MQHKYLDIFEKNFSLFSEDIVTERSLDIEVQNTYWPGSTVSGKIKKFFLLQDPIIMFVFLCIARVGKTSLSTKFVHGQFDKQQSSTVDASYLEKVIQVGEKRVKMVVWDTAGQEKYHALAKNYYQGASGALLVYDVTDEDSF